MLRANSSLPIGHLHSFHGTSKSTYIYIYHLKFWFDMFLHCSVLRHVYQHCLSSRTNALTHLKAFRLASTWLFVVSANQSFRAIRFCKPPWKICDRQVNFRCTNGVCQINISNKHPISLYWLVNRGFKYWGVVVPTLWGSINPRCYQTPPT